MNRERGAAASTPVSKTGNEGSSPSGLAIALAELKAAQEEELEASNAYAGDDLTEDWHRAALARLMRAEDAVARARKAT